METIRIEIRNPKAMQLLKDLADLKLIAFADKDDKINQLKSILKQLRSNAEYAPSLEEITNEVEEARRERYEAKS